MRSPHLKRITSDIVHYTLNPFHKPVVEVKPGESVVVETVDALCGAVTEESPLERLLEEGRLPDYFNPVSGPIYVKTARPGDTLVVEVIDIKVGVRGVTVNFPGFGGLTVPYLQENLPPKTKISQIRNGIIHFPMKNGRTIKIPVHPLIGTIGTAPPIESQLSTKPDKHGGNMDCSDVTIGNKLYLPVFVDGALLYLGDAHAVQGDCEICGVAVETPSETIVKVDIIHDKSVNWPRVETPNEIITICSSASLEHATKLALTELIFWITTDYGFDRMDAYLLCSQVAKVRICQIVNERYTVAAKFPKTYL
jgi:amidase